MSAWTENKGRFAEKRGASRGGSTPELKYKRYMALAREAEQAGDMVERENCYQHAEHYFRVMRSTT